MKVRENKSQVLMKIGKTTTTTTITTTTINAMFDSLHHHHVDDNIGDDKIKTGPRNSCGLHHLKRKRKE